MIFVPINLRPKLTLEIILKSETIMYEQNDGTGSTKQKCDNLIIK